jgi:hypothetical protein
LYFGFATGLQDEEHSAVDCVHLRAGCKERDVSKKRNAGPSGATPLFGGAIVVIG